MVKMTEETPGDEGPSWERDNSTLEDKLRDSARVNKLREHLRAGGMVTNIDDVRSLMAEHDRLWAQNSRLFSFISHTSSTAKILKLQADKMRELRREATRESVLRLNPEAIRK